MYVRLGFMTNAKLTPETDAQRNVRLLAAAVCTARNALAALQDQGHDSSVRPSLRGPVATKEQLEAAEAVVHAAEVAWNSARLALVVA